MSGVHSHIFLPCLCLCLCFVRLVRSLHGFRSLGTYSISQPMRGSRTDLPAYTTRTCDPHSTSKAQPRTSPNVSPLPELALSLLEYVCARLSPWSGQGVRSMLLLLSGLVEASPVASSLPFTGAATISGNESHHDPTRPYTGTTTPP